jgi:hypothetical protein
MSTFTTEDSKVPEKRDRLGRRIPVKRQRRAPRADAPMDAWIGVNDLAAAEGVSRRAVYAQLDLGMKHSRIGDRIRVRRSDWAAWHEAHIIGGGR